MEVKFPPTLPSPTPIRLEWGTLIGGAIAGIVIGSVAGVTATAGFEFWLWKRRRTPKKGTEASTGCPPDKKELSGEEAPQHSAMTERRPDTLRPELPARNSGIKIELPADNKYDGAKSAKPGESGAELDANNPLSAKKAPASACGFQ